MMISEFSMSFDPAMQSVVACDLMTPVVASLRTSAQLREVLEAMAQCGIGTVPVLDADGGVVAIVTEESVAKAEMLGLWSGGVTWRDVTLAHRMTKAVFHFAEPAASVSVDASLVEIVDTMLTKRLRAIPVVHGGRICGMITWAAIFEALMRIHGAA